MNLFAFNKILSFIFFYYILFISVSFFSSYFSRDSDAYRSLIEFYSSQGSYLEIFGRNHEALFVFLSKITGDLNLPSFILFMIYAFFSISLKKYLITRYSRISVLSFVFYISFFLLSQDATAIRASLAIGLLYFALIFLSNKKYFAFVFSVSVVALFVHYSAVAFLFMLVLNIKGVEFLLLFSFLMSILFSLFSFNSNFIDYFVVRFHYFSDSEVLVLEKIYGYLLYSQSSDEFYSPFTVLNITAYFFAIVFWLYRRDFSRYEFLCYKSFLLSCFIYNFFSFIPAIQIRISDIFAFSFVFIFPFCFYFLRRFFSKYFAVSFIFFACSIVFIRKATYLVFNYE